MKRPNLPKLGVVTCFNFLTHKDMKNLITILAVILLLIAPLEIIFINRYFNIDAVETVAIIVSYAIQMMLCMFILIRKIAYFNP